MHAIVAHTFLNVCEKIHQFLSSIKKLHTERNGFLFSASRCKAFLSVPRMQSARTTYGDRSFAASGPFSMELGTAAT